MGLGVNAPVAASHIVLLIVFAVSIARLLHLLHAPRRIDGSRWVFPLAICLVFAMLAIERVYYIAARFLLPHGVNLWGEHPAPAVLSILVALAAWSITPFIFAARGWDRARIWRHSLGEIAGLGLIWFGLFRSLL